MALTLKVFTRLYETPGQVDVGIGDGPPGAEAAFHVGGDPTVVWTDTIDVNGWLRTSVPIRPLSVGTHNLHVAAGSETDTAPFEVLGPPVDSSSEPIAGDPVPPIAGPFTRWTLYDPRDPNHPFTFARNPQKWSGPPERTLYYEFQSTTAPDGNIITWQKSGRAWPMEFSGYLSTHEEYQILNAWAHKRNRIWLYDHTQTWWSIALTYFDAQARLDRGMAVQLGAEWIWSHDYTMQCLVFNKPNWDPFGVEN